MAVNRDEFYSRPSRAANFWGTTPEILAGKDLVGGGTWLGITRTGKVAAITNFRDPLSYVDTAPSRGRIVLAFLKGNKDIKDHIVDIAKKAHEYNGFNLFMGNLKEYFFYSNRTGDIKRLQPGIYGLSNHLLDTPWPKLAKGKKLFQDLISKNRKINWSDLLPILLDNSLPPDYLLPDTGVGIQRERMLAPLFIKSPDYGTCSSTVILFARDDNVFFFERSYYPFEEEQHSDVEFHFKMETL